MTHVFAGIAIRLRDPRKTERGGMTEKEYRKCFEAIMNHGGDVETKNESGSFPSLVI